MPNLCPQSTIFAFPAPNPDATSRSTVRDVSQSANRTTALSFDQFRIKS